MPPETISPDNTAHALEKINRLLRVRDHSLLELRQKLLRTFNEETTAHALAMAAQGGILASDEEIAARAAEVYARQRKSRRYIEGRLTKRGLPVPIIEEEAEKEKARWHLIKKFTARPTLGEYERGEAFRYLERRGFEEYLIEQVLDEKR